MNDSTESLEDAQAPLLADRGVKSNNKGFLSSIRRLSSTQGSSSQVASSSEQQFNARGADATVVDKEMTKGQNLGVSGGSRDNLVIDRNSGGAARGGNRSQESLEMDETNEVPPPREPEGDYRRENGPFNGDRRVTSVDVGEEEAEGMSQDDIKHGAAQVINLIIPVSICMMFVVATMQSITYYKDGGGQTLYYIAFKENDNQSSGEKFGGAIVNVIIIIGVILAMTCLLVVLYKYRCYKAIWLWMFLSTCMLQFLFTYTYLLMVLDRYNTPMDWITFVFVIWNFGVVGVLSIHYKLPLLLQQGYLIITSALLALTLIKYLPDWTTWILLGAIAVYDLFAVLCPRGPLKVLVETAQARNEPLFPALVYSSTMLWLVGGMADVETPTNGRSSQQQLNRQSAPAAVEEREATDEEAAGEEEERHGVKLGLGDFIFYSVLVGKAATRDEWSTILACFVAILVGLCLTLLLLAVFRHALPALPISIAFGLVFYFTSRYVLVPFNEQLAIDQVFV
eukprot:Opistho-2@21321